MYVPVRPGLVGFERRAFAPVLLAFVLLCWKFFLFSLFSFCLLLAAAPLADTRFHPLFRRTCSRSQNQHILRSIAQVMGKKKKKKKKKKGGVRCCVASADFYTRLKTPLWCRLLFWPFHSFFLSFLFFSLLLSFFNVAAVPRPKVGGVEKRF